MNCQGKRIAFTGIAANYERGHIHSAIQQAGGRVDNSVTGKTSLLVIGENPGNGLAKRQAAEKLGIPTMMAREFMEAVRDGSAAWPYAERTTRKATKKKAVPKEVKQALAALSKADAMPGFVGV